MNLWCSTYQVQCLRNVFFKFMDLSNTSWQVQKPLVHLTLLTKTCMRKFHGKLFWPCTTLVGKCRSRLAPGRCPGMHEISKASRQVQPYSLRAGRCTGLSPCIIVFVFGTLKYFWCSSVLGSFLDSKFFYSLLIISNLWYMYGVLNIDKKK